MIVASQSSSPARVLHVLGSMNRGGVETRLLEIMRRIDPARIVFDFCVLSGEPGAYAAEIERLGGRILPCSLTPNRGTFLARFVTLLRRGRYDVVHSHVHQFSGVVLLASRAAGIRTRIASLNNTHDGRAATLGRRAYRRCTRALVDRHATTILGVSEGVLEALWGPGWRNDPRKMVLYLGVDSARFRDPAGVATVRRELAVADSAPLLIHVGRFDPQKNHGGLVRIAQRLLARRRDVTFLLVGDGPLRPAIEEHVVATGLGTSFRFAGNRDDVPRLLAASDIFVFPSLWEGLPGAVLEALAAGLPVAASPLPGVIEIARRTSGVVTADPGDPGAFARTIETLLDERTRAPKPPFPLLPIELTAEFLTARLLTCYGAAPPPEAQPIGHTGPPIDGGTRAHAAASAPAHADVRRLASLGRSDTP